MAESLGRNGRLQLSPLLASLPRLPVRPKECFNLLSGPTKDGGGDEFFRPSIALFQIIEDAQAAVREARVKVIVVMGCKLLNRKVVNKRDPPVMLSAILLFKRKRVPFHGLRK
jgi:hypothetical protein